MEPTDQAQARLDAERPWLRGERTYEGFPLLLRRPKDFVFGSRRLQFPSLLVVTLEFARRRPDGLPEPDYNESLFDLESELMSAFDMEPVGLAVLVETFGGKRHWYYYVSPKGDVQSAVSTIAGHFPAERLTWTVRPDPQWSFLDRYAADFF